MTAKAKQASDFGKSLSEARKLRKDDVNICVKTCLALDNENEPTWKEVKTMKDILSKLKGSPGPAASDHFPVTVKFN